MNEYNVLDQPSSLQDLELDYFQWSRLPYDQKKRSDENAIRLYGCTNTEFYNKLKDKFINSQDTTSTDIKMYIRESNSPDAMDTIDNILNSEDFKDKYNMSLRYQQSPLIVIIDPLDGYDTVLYKWESFNKLNETYRLWSNNYSQIIWGYNVINMFKYMQVKYKNNAVKTNLYQEVYDKFYTEAYCKGDIIDIITLEDAFDKEIDLNTIDEFYINKVVPYLTLEEMSELGIDSTMIANIEDYQSYKKSLYEAYRNNDEKAMLSLGWNPSAPINEDTLKFARDKQLWYFNNNCPTVVYLSNINEDAAESITESSKVMNGLYKAKNLYPIFIVMSYIDSLFGKAERFIKNVNYSHVGLSVDSDLSEIFTFGFGKYYNGFTVEDLDKYIKESKDATMAVACVFVDAETRNVILKNLNDINANRNKTKYGFGNILNIVMNKQKDYNYPDNMALVCSQFVDTILKLADIDLTNKSSNLVLPQDFHEVRDSKVYIIYEGYCKDYDEKLIESSIKNLFSKNSIKNIKYKESIYDNFSESTKAKIDDLLTPVGLLTERKTHIRFKYDGSLEIDLIKSLEDQYQESHKLLESYTDDNIEGIKREVAHMFYINSVIEKKIRKMKKASDEYKLYTNLRARVINDFKKYLKFIQSKDKSFDFGEYFKTSDYYNGSVIVDQPTMKYSGELIKKLIRGINSFR
jgi:hypothetical protein